MTEWFLFILLSLATFRVTRLITRDDFPPVYWARTKIQNMRPEHTQGEGAKAHWEFWWLGELVSCPWCASGWVSLIAVFGVDVVLSLPLPWLWWLAVWGAAALVANAVE